MSTSQSQVVSPPALDPEWKAIPLEKFSSATSSLGAASHHWVHDVRKDELFLVFRPVRHPYVGDALETRLMMTISAGAEILEHQDVVNLVKVAGEFDNLQRHGRLDRTTEAPVHVVIKLPCIALRYPTSLNMVRRIQMRFKTESDYQRATKIFKELGLPMRSAGSKESSAASLRPLKTAPDPLVQNTSGLSSICAFPAPAPNNLKPSYFPDPNLHPSVGSPFFKRPQATNLEIRKVDGVWMPEDMRAARMPSSMSLIQPPTSPKPTTILNRLVSSSFGDERNMERHVPAMVAPMRKLEPAEYTNSQNLDCGSIPLSGTASELFGPPLPSYRGNEIPITAPASRSDLGQFKRAASAYGVPQRENDSSLEKLPLLPSEALRPMSAPVHNAHYLSSPPIPPRRQLPFPKTRGTTKPCAPMNESSVVPPSEQPDRGTSNTDDALYITPAASTPDPKRTSRMPRKSNVMGAMETPEDNLLDSNKLQHPHDEGSGGICHRVEEPSPLAGKSRVLTRPATAPGLRSKVTATANRKRPSELPDQTASVSKQIKRTMDRGTQTQTLSGRDHTAPLGTSLLANDRLVTQPVNSTRAPSPPLPFMDQIDAFVSKYKTRSPPQELWLMPGYTEASPEERQTIINDFICENLESEEFLQLCEDTASVWRRIGLEM